MNIKHIIKLLLPYYITNKIIQRNKSNRVQQETQSHEKDFVEDYNNYCESNKDAIKLDTSCKYKTIISVQGFGYSGSGAVVDLLREFPSCQVFGNVDFEGSATKRAAIFEEVDFARLYGGLFDIEHYLNSNNLFQNDGVLNNFAKLVGCSKIYRCSEDIKQYFLCFFDNLVSMHIRLGWQAYNPHLNFNFHNPNIFFLKNHSISDYRTLCKSLIYTLFNSLHTEGKECLVLDQFFTDFEFNTKRNKEYIPNLKTIVVYRDPRDVYAFAKNINVEWIAHDSVEDFIKWHKICYHNFSPSSTDYLPVRFEDLVFDYDKVVTTIKEYLNVSDHKFVKCNFDPSLSSKNVCIWKQSNIDIREFCKIKEQLNEYCYLD